MDTHLPYLGTVDWLLSPGQAAILGLTLYTGAYTTEALRSANAFFARLALPP